MLDFLDQKYGFDKMDNVIREVVERGEKYSPEDLDAIIEKYNFTTKELALFQFLLICYYDEYKNRVEHDSKT